MKTLRTAAVGAGRIGWQYHLPQTVEHDGFELVAVVDPLADRLAEAAREFDTKGYSDHQSMLSEQKPDLVVICSPTPFHVEQAIAAFEAGCDVFCDKPVAPSLDEAERIFSTAEKHGRKFMAYQPHRTHTICLALQDILSQGLIGPVYMMRRGQSRWRRRNDWQAWKKNGGGMLNNYGPHAIDQLLYVTGSKATKVSCSLRKVASLGDADDVAKVSMETDNGIVIDIDINQASAWRTDTWDVFGQTGTAIYDRPTKTWNVRYFLPGELPELSVQEGMAAEGRIYKVGEIDDWREKQFPISDYERTDFYQKCYEYFGLDAEPFVTVAQTRELMRVLDVCKRSASEGGWG